MATDRRQKPRTDSEDRRKPGQQFGRGTGAFSEVVNMTFAILREQEKNGSLLSNDDEGVS